VQVAVSGASGFIGRHVLAELARRQQSVVAIARDASRVAPAPGVSVVALDLAAPPQHAYELLGRPDVLIHLAWEGLPNFNAARHVEIELPRQSAFLRSLIADGLPALVITGTCLEYGLQSGALHEALPTAPVTSYAMAKDRLRRELEGLRTTHGFALNWARLFYTYGPGQAPGSLLPQLAAAVARGDQRFDMSGGEQLRDYLPVEEVAKLLVALALRRCDAGVVNVCSGKPVRIRDLVAAWLAAHHWQIALNLGHYPYPAYEPMAFWGVREHLDKVLAAD
jgi:dTDP-6-deoxy-L-talose 4-dehydrogenase (NAD+)